MNRALLALAVLALAAGYAGAEPTDLSTGVFITHHPAGAEYTTDVADWCAEFTTQGWEISSFGEQNARIDCELEEARTWYVIAAFTDGEDKTWCGIGFGLGDFVQETTFYIGGAGFCLDGALEIPSDGWPGPNENTSVVATATPWSGNYVPIYWFGGYIYGAGAVPLAGLDIEGSIKPPSLANCLAPSVEYPLAEGSYGTMGILQDGVGVGGVVVPQYACCDETDGSCSIMTEDACDTALGVWYDGETCDPKPCEEICCLDAAHSYECVDNQTEAECTAAQGTWHPEQDNNCDALGDTFCSTAVPNVSWGEIKTLYK